MQKESLVVRWLGTTFFHASMKFESVAGAAGRSVEKHHDLAGLCIGVGELLIVLHIRMGFHRLHHHGSKVCGKMASGPNEGAPFFHNIGLRRENLLCFVLL